MQSGMLKAGTVLLLVGAILHAVGAFFLTAAGLLFLLIDKTFLGDGEATFPATFVGALYLFLGLVMVVGSFFGFSAWRQSQGGQLHSAWVRGLVASLLPPLQVVTLLGAIFVLVSPEHEAQEKARRGWQSI